jgi:stage II sporulation protein AA (anti-sigma F factor antagonist)
LTALRNAHARLSLSRMPSEAQLVRDMWRAHESGGFDAFFAMVGEDIVWQPFLTGDHVFRSTTELRQALADLAEQGVRFEPQLHDLEQHGNVVLVHGSLRVSDNGRSDETPVHWAYHFRDGRLRRQSTHPSREEALEALSALRLLDEATFSLAEDAGGEGECVIRLRGELDIESAPDLERVLLRSRPAGQRVVVDLAELKFMDSTGLRVLLRARAAADEGRWEIGLCNVPPTIRRLFDMTGVHAALPAETS